MAWDMQPRYSPDGKWIAFTSDRAGGDNLWIMDANGGSARQITKEDFRLLNNPVWHPNGRYIAGRKHFTTRRSLGTGEIWLYSLDGGDGVQLVKRPSEEFQKELGEPVFSPDGQIPVLQPEHARPAPRFEYAQDVNKAVFGIRRYELASGEIDDAVSEPGGAVRPTPSPDGRWLAYVHRVRTPNAFETALFVKDLVSGEERPLYTDLDRDMQETWAINGLYPNMDWTPDSKSIVFWAGGGIKRIDVASGAVQRHSLPRQGHARSTLRRRASTSLSRRTKCSRAWCASRAFRRTASGRVRIVRTPVAEKRGRRRRRVA